MNIEIITREKKSSHFKKNCSLNAKIIIDLFRTFFIYALCSNACTSNDILYVPKPVAGFQLGQPLIHTGARVIACWNKILLLLIIALSENMHDAVFVIYCTDWKHYAVFGIYCTGWTHDKFWLLFIVHAEQSCFWNGSINKEIFFQFQTKLL